jgi:hypothetical protein
MRRVISGESKLTYSAWQGIRRSVPRAFRREAERAIRSPSRGERPGSASARHDAGVTLGESRQRRLVLPALGWETANLEDPSRQHGVFG